MKSIVLMLCVLLAGACARAYPPPGGDVDELPPRLLATTPAGLAVVTANEEPVVFKFDERISERGFSEALVLVSPLDGALRVDRGRDEVRVSIDGGWRADRVYRVLLLPGIADLFGNAREEAAELVFSTGPPMQETAIHGFVEDRITGRAAQRAVVTALRRSDGALYTAIGDAEGFFALRHLPYGAYELRAFSDGNNNRRRDSLEPVDSGQIKTIGAAADTAVVIFQVLSRDTTATRVRDAAVVDSIRVRVRTDDYLDPATAFANATAEVLVLPDSARYALASLGAIRPPQPPGAAADSTPLRPANEFHATLSRVLAPGRYVIRIGGLTNLSGVTGGGGSASFEVRAPARTDTLQVSRRR